MVKGGGEGGRGRELLIAFTLNPNTWLTKKKKRKTGLFICNMNITQSTLATEEIFTPH